MQYAGSSRSGMLYVLIGAPVLAGQIYTFALGRPTPTLLPSTP